MTDHFTYEIEYTKVADKYFRAHEDIRNSYESAIYKLLTGDHPESVDVKRIRGKHNEYYRIRLGGVRIVYTVIGKNVIVVTTILAGSRGDVYKKMTGLK